MRQQKEYIDGGLPSPSRFGQMMRRRRVYVKNRRKGSEAGRGIDVPRNAPRLHVLFVEIFKNPLLCEKKGSPSLLQGHLLRMQLSADDTTFPIINDDRSTTKCSLLIPDGSLVRLRPNEILS